MDLPKETEEMSEDAILGLIDNHFANEHTGVSLGRGDDCAVIWPASDVCVSSDLFLEDIHFRRAYFEPGEIGHKALAVNISDLAGMGAKPLAFNLNLGLPNNVDMRWLDAFFAGMANLAVEQSMALIGGDISRSDRLHISITALGQGCEGCTLLRRGGIMSGDILFLIGPIGLARIGLEELEKRGRGALAQWPESCEAHLRPQPQTGAGLMLGRAGYNARPPALMDVSDGLAADLPRLLGKSGGKSSLGADIQLPESSLHNEILRHAEINGRDPVEEAFKGGEDYALLGACAPDMLPALKAAMPGLLKIGVVTLGGQIMCNGRDFSPLAGFDHFRSREPGNDF